MTASRPTPEVSFICPDARRDSRFAARLDCRCASRLAPGLPIRGAPLSRCDSRRVSRLPPRVPIRGAPPLAPGLPIRAAPSLPLRVPTGAACPDSRRESRFAPRLHSRCESRLAPRVPTGAASPDSRCASRFAARHSLTPAASPDSRRVTPDSQRAATPGASRLLPLRVPRREDYFGQVLWALSAGCVAANPGVWRCEGGNKSLGR